MNDLTPINRDRIEDILALNNIHKDMTSEHTLAEFQEILDETVFTIGVDEGAGGFLTVIDQTATKYESPNFAWFKARYDRFLYVDRIIIGTAFQGRGLGRVFYEKLFEFARANDHDTVVAEISFSPPNPQSDAFHERLGFIEVGKASIHFESKIVRYVEKKLT